VYTTVQGTSRPTGKAFAMKSSWISFQNSVVPGVKMKVWKVFGIRGKVMIIRHGSRSCIEIFHFAMKCELPVWNPCCFVGSETVGPKRISGRREMDAVRELTNEVTRHS